MTRILYELRVDGKLLHTFAPQAKNEIAILKALEALGWPRQISDPLGNDDEPGFEKRLSDTACAG